MASYRLSRQADEDLTELLAFGTERFGPAQAKRYQADLLTCFALIADTPGMGRRASRRITHIRRHEHRSHVILYEVLDSDVLVLAILHKRSLRRVPR